MDGTVFAPAAPGATQPIIHLDRVSRTYDMGRVAVHALNDVSLQVAAGEFVAIVGPSGSGKSTMMNILGCLDRPTAGTYVLAGTPVAALDNVATPLLYQNVSRKDRIARATAALERLGLGDRLDHEPTELSGGQQQRVAVARALVTDPAILLADEPTGNLDTHSGREVLDLLLELNRAGRTIILITHDTDVASAASRQIHLRDGRIADFTGLAA
jgi:putative ABC transport system ATP-binding protein